MSSSTLGPSGTTATARPRYPVPLPAMPPWKRALDLAGCVAALPFFGLCFGAVSLVLALTSRGPILFRQKRVGLRGRVFNMYKFRTMHADVETVTHQAHVIALLRSQVPMQKLDGQRDARVVPGAWLLRVSGLDELPQILNVLRGDMSLVGPRPCLKYEYQHYTSEQRRRCQAMPGLTGLWQVSGKNRTTFARMIELDIEYAGRKSLGLDLRIIALTLPALAGQMIDTGLQRWRARRHRGPAATALPATSERRL